MNSITIPSSELNMDGATGDKEVTPGYQPVSAGGSKIFGRVIQKGEGCHQGGGFGEQDILGFKTSQIEGWDTTAIRNTSMTGISVNLVIRGLKEDLDQLSAAAWALRWMWRIWFRREQRGDYVPAGVMPMNW